MAFIYDLTDTWNAGGTTFNAIKMNVTDTASAAASKLITVQVSGSEKFSVKKDGVGYFAGNVGIGTNTPNKTLDIVGDATSATIELKNNLGQGLDLTGGSSGVDIATPNALPITFNTSGSERLRITSTGSVGIGTSSPDSAALLDVVSSNGKYVRTKVTAADSTTGYILANDARTWIIRANGSNSDALEFRNATSGRQEMVIDTSGRVGIGTTSPSALLEIAANNNGSENNTFRITDTDTFVASGDTLGKIEFYATDGAAIKSFVKAEYSSSQGDAELVFGTSDSASAATERMRITSAGLVGIGTSSPATLTAGITALSISDTGAKTTGDKIGELNFVTDDASFTGTYADGIGAAINAVSTSATGAAYGLSFTTATITGSNRAERVRITETGNVGIGASSPLAVSGYNTLSINGASGGALALYVNGTVAGSIAAFSNDMYYDSVDATIWRNGAAFNTTPTERMRIDSSGRLLLGSSINSTDFKFQITGAGGSAGDLSLDSNASYSEIQSFNSKPLYLNRQGNNTILNATAGNVGIGTSSPANTNGGLDASGALIARGGIAAHQTSAGAFDFSTDELRLRSYGATAGSGRITFRTGGGAGSSDTERMRITSSGSVGIGTTSPSARLDVGAGVSSEAIQVNAGSGWSDLILKSSASNGGSVVWNDGADAGEIFYYHVDNSMSFKTNATERARIDSSGRLLVGTTTVPDGSTNGQSFSGAEFRSSRDTTSAVQHVRFYNLNGQVGNINTNGSATNYVTSSDARLKDNIADAEDAANLIDAIQVRKFDWKADGSHQRYGMIAQELVEVAPEAVQVPQDEDEMMGVDYSKLVPMLVKEIQSLRARVAQLEG